MIPRPRGPFMSQHVVRNIKSISPPLPTPSCSLCDVSSRPLDLPDTRHLDILHISPRPECTSFTPGIEGKFTICSSLLQSASSSFPLTSHKPFSTQHPRPILPTTQPSNQRLPSSLICTKKLLQNKPTSHGCKNTVFSAVNFAPPRKEGGS